mmetsp:Transcript_35595/g.36301  ORF Transcript_35595/g.36301 Transcript_35595/m.36301 type:complete len:139 (+) Transcript_35595:335-751(+)
MITIFSRILPSLLIFIIERHNIEAFFTPYSYRRTNSLYLPNLKISKGYSLDLSVNEIPEDENVIRVRVRKVPNLDEMVQIAKNSSAETSGAYSQLSGGYMDVNMKENMYLYLWSALIGGLETSREINSNKHNSTASLL